MNDAPFGLWFETAVGTISVVGLVLGCSDLGPGLLRIILALFGTVGVAFTFYSIFEALEIQCYRTFTDPDDGPGGGGPDDGEFIPSHLLGDIETRRYDRVEFPSVVKFPRRAA